MPTPTHPQDQPPTLTEYDGFPIYPMPMFARIAATDPMATTDFFTRVLDFDVVFTGPEVDGVPVLVHLRRARYQDVMVNPAADEVRPSPSLAIVIQGLDADTVDALAERAVAAGGDVEGPVDTPWHTRDFTIHDPDGNVFVVTGRGRDAGMELPESLTTD